MAIAFKKPTRKPKAVRKKSQDDDDETTQSSTTLVNIKKTTHRRAIIQNTKNRGVGIGSVTNVNIPLSSLAAKRKQKEQERLALALSIEETEVGVEEEAEATDLGERLQDTFSSNAAELGSGENDDKDNPASKSGQTSSGVLGKKHRAAMEEYINERSKSVPDKPGNAHVGDTAATVVENPMKKLNEEDLFQELARNVISMGDAPAGEIEASAAADGDVGAGGAMLGGTGIAEVALPVDERIRNVRDTETAAAEREAFRQRRRGGGFGHPNHFGRRPGSRGAKVAVGDGVVSGDDGSALPMSFAVGPGKRKRPQSAVAADAAAPTTRSTPNTSTNTTAVSTFQSSASSAGVSVLHRDIVNVPESYSHNFRLHTNKWVNDRKAERETEFQKVKLAREEEEGPLANRERIGFAAARGGGVAVNANAAATASGGGGDKKNGYQNGHKNHPLAQHKLDRNRNDGWTGNERSNDDRVWKTFMKRQRERGGKR